MLDVERWRKRVARETKQNRHAALLHDLAVILLEAARGKAHAGKWREPPAQKPARRCAADDGGLPSAPCDPALTKPTAAQPPAVSVRHEPAASNEQRQERRELQAPAAAGPPEPRVPWAEPPRQFSAFADRIERHRVHYPSRTFNAGVPRSVFSSVSAPALHGRYAPPGRFGGPCRR